MCVCVCTDCAEMYSSKKYCIYVLFYTYYVQNYYDTFIIFLYNIINVYYNHSIFSYALLQYKISRYNW